MPPRSRVKPPPEPEPAESESAAAEQVMVDPAHLPVDGLEAAAGGVVRLREVLAQHAPAEPRFVPWDFVAFRPGRGLGGAIEDVDQIHG